MGSLLSWQAPPESAQLSKPGFASRLIEDEADVLDVIAMLRLNYERVVAKHDLPELAA